MSDEEAVHFMKENYYLSDIKAKESVKISRNELNILDEIDYKNGYSLYVGIPFALVHAYIVHLRLIRFQDSGIKLTVI